MKFINFDKLKGIFKKGNISLKKVVIATTLVSVISFTGCAQNNKATNNIFSEQGIGITSLEKSTSKNMYKLNTINQECINKYANFDTDSFNLECNIFCSPSEFSKYIDEKNVTWDDIKETIKNMDVKDNIKNIILKGATNLEKNNFNMNLDVLNYNLKNMSFEYVDTNSQISTSDDTIVAATFVAQEHKLLIYVDNFDNKEGLLLHEVFGHGMTYAYIDDKKVLCSDDIVVTYIQNNKIEYMSRIGDAFNEGIAELIKYYALNEKINNDDTAYTPYVYALLLLCKMNNISVAEYANNGMEYLLNKMADNGLANVSGIVNDIDDNFKSCLYNNTKVEYSLEYYIEEYLSYYIDKEMIKTNDLDRTITKVNNLVDCYKKVINPKMIENKSPYFIFSNGTVGDYVGIDNLKQFVKEYSDNYKYQNELIMR